MTWPELLATVSAFSAAVAAFIAYAGRQSVVAMQRKWDSSLKKDEDANRAALKRVEDFQKSLLTRSEEAIKSALREAEDRQKAALLVMQAAHQHRLDQDAELARARLRRQEEAYKRELDRELDTFRANAARLSVVDNDLRSRRASKYAALWGLTSLLPRWPRDETLEYQRLDQLAFDLKDWYYEQGGMWLSTPARDAFFAVQEALQAVRERRSGGAISESDYESVRSKCSALRTQLSVDLESRRGVPETERPPARTDPPASP